MPPYAALAPPWHGPPQHPGHPAPALRPAIPVSAPAPAAPPAPPRPPAPPPPPDAEAEAPDPLELRLRRERKAREDVAIDPEKTKEICLEFLAADREYLVLLDTKCRVEQELAELEKEAALLHASAEADLAARNAASRLEDLDLG